MVLLTMLKTDASAHRAIPQQVDRPRSRRLWMKGDGDRVTAQLGRAANTPTYQVARCACHACQSRPGCTVPHEEQRLCSGGEL